MLLGLLPCCCSRRATRTLHPPLRRRRQRPQLPPPPHPPSLRTSRPDLRHCSSAPATSRGVTAPTTRRPGCCSTITQARRCLPLATTSTATRRSRTSTTATGHRGGATRHA